MIKQMISSVELQAGVKKPVWYMGFTRLENTHDVVVFHIMPWNFVLRILAWFAGLWDVSRYAGQFRAQWGKNPAVAFKTVESRLEYIEGILLSMSANESRNMTNIRDIAERTRENGKRQDIINSKVEINAKSIALARNSIHNNEQTITLARNRVISRIEELTNIMETEHLDLKTLLIAALPEEKPNEDTKKE